MIYLEEIVKVTTQSEWSINEDREGVRMVYYKGVPAEEIIYAVGEISLAIIFNLSSIQQEYYDDELGDVFNTALKLVRDTGFAKEFYTHYKLLDNSIRGVLE